MSKLRKDLRNDMERGLFAKRVYVDPLLRGSQRRATVATKAFWLMDLRDPNNPIERVVFVSRFGVRRNLLMDRFTDVLDSGGNIHRFKNDPRGVMLIEIPWEILRGKEGYGLQKLESERKISSENTKFKIAVRTASAIQKTDEVRSGTKFNTSLAISDLSGKYLQIKSKNGTSISGFVSRQSDGHIIVQYTSSIRRTILLEEIQSISAPRGDVLEFFEDKSKVDGHQRQTFDYYENSDLKVANKQSAAIPIVLDPETKVDFTGLAMTLYFPPQNGFGPRIFHATRLREISRSGSGSRILSYVDMYTGEVHKFDLAETEVRMSVDGFIESSLR